MGLQAASVQWRITVCTFPLSHILWLQIHLKFRRTRYSEKLQYVHFLCHTFCGCKYTLNLGGLGIVTNYSMYISSVTHFVVTNTS
jgi:hypothetical protein